MNRYVLTPRIHGDATASQVVGFDCVVNLPSGQQSRMYVAGDYKAARRAGEKAYASAAPAPNAAAQPKAKAPKLSKTEIDAIVAKCRADQLRAAADLEHANHRAEVALTYLSPHAARLDEQMNVGAVNRSGNVEFGSGVLTLGGKTGAKPARTRKAPAPPRAADEGITASRLSPQAAELDRAMLGSGAAEPQFDAASNTLTLNPPRSRK